MASALVRPASGRAFRSVLPGGGLSGAGLSGVVAATVLAAAFSGGQSAWAVVTFDFTTPSSPTTTLERTFSSGGINLKVDNAQGNNITTAFANIGEPHSSPSQFGGVNTDMTNGLCVALYTNISTGKCQYSTLTEGNSPGSPTLTGLTFAFDQPVRLLGFQIMRPGGVREGVLSFSAGALTETFTFLNPNNNDSINGTGYATMTFKQGFRVAAKTPITLDSSQTQFFALTGGPSSEAGSFRINNFQVEQVPGPVPVLGAAAAFGWSRRIRKKLAAAARPHDRA
jgi:hypothetical protein